MFSERIHPVHLERLAERFAGVIRRKSLWGLAPRAPLHIGYDPLFLQHAAVTKARRAEHVVLLADLHAELTSQLGIAAIRERAAYYERYLDYLFGDRVEVVLGSALQTSPAYVRQLYKVLNDVSIAKVRGAAPRQMKAGGQRDTLSVVYLLMQCLDILELDVDLVFAERSQEKIYELTPTVAGSLGSAPSVEHIYVAGACDILGQPMAVSSRKTRLSFHDEGLLLAEKIRRMYAPPAGAPPNEKPNALLAAFEWSVFPWRREPIRLHSSRLAATISFERYDDLAEAYAAGDVHPADCKDALFIALDERFRGIRNHLGETASWVQPETK